MAVQPDDWSQAGLLQAVALLLRAGNAMQVSGPLEEGLDVYERAGQLAARAGLEAERLTAFLGVAGCCLQLGDYARAGQVLHTARDLARELGARADGAHAAQLLGEVSFFRGNLRDARTWFEDALREFEQLADLRAQTTLRLELSRVDAGEGHLDRAKTNLERALRTAVRLRFDGLTRASGRELAVIHYRQGNLAAAKAQARETLKLMERADDAIGTVNMWHLLGLIARDHEDLGSAQRCLERAAALARESGNIPDYGNALRELGIVALSRGDFAVAGSCLVEGLRQLQSTDHRYDEALTWAALGLMALERDDLRAAALLSAIATLLHQSVGTSDAQAEAARGYQILGALARQATVAADVRGLLQASADAYQRDRGWSLIQGSFGALDLRPPPV